MLRKYRKSSGEDDDDDDDDGDDGGEEAADDDDEDDEEDEDADGTFQPSSSTATTRLSASVHRDSQKEAPTSVAQ